MIERVRIENFRALRNVDVRLKPLTVLIGPNDTGKSSFLDAIHLYDDRMGFERVEWWRQQTPARVVLSPKQEGTAVDGSVKLFRLPIAGIPMESEGVADSQYAPSLGGDGARLAAVLDYFLRRDRHRFDQVVLVLRQLLPGFGDLRIETPSPPARRIIAVIENGLELAGGQLSAGVRLMFFFVTLAYHPKPPSTLLIEEPENGVHPKRLGEIMGMLRGLTTGALGAPPVQVILTTHSPYLLDHVRLTPAEDPEDQVLVFRREADGSRSVTEADPQRLAPFLLDFMLGEVWYNQDEDGLVAKR